MFKQTSFYSFVYETLILFALCVYVYSVEFIEGEGPDYKTKYRVINKYGHPKYYSNNWYPMPRLR